MGCPFLQSKDTKKNPYGQMPFPSFTFHFPTGFCPRPLGPKSESPPKSLTKAKPLKTSTRRESPRPSREIPPRRCSISKTMVLNQQNRGAQSAKPRWSSIKTEEEFFSDRSCTKKPHPEKGVALWLGDWPSVVVVLLALSNSVELGRESFLKGGDGRR